MKLRWIYKTPPSDNSIKNISYSLGFGYLESKILLNRGIDSYEKAREFFKPKVSDIHDPFLMKDMRKAVDRINKSIEKKEKILILGDYDVDGTTAVALVYTYLCEIYDPNKLDFYIPDRNLEGYGISTESIYFAKKNNFSLIIALDCGIKSVDKVEYANNINIDFIICDHHLPGNKIPEAVAVLDPKRNDCNYPYKELSGCGVGYKLCCALNSVHKLPDEKLLSLTDLLAISIAADIVPITGENRILTKIGLKKLRNTNRYGIKYIVNKEKIKIFNVSNIVFEIAPKINAAGRLLHGKLAVELLISDNETKALQIAQQITNLNIERKELDTNITQQAVEQIKNTNQEDNFTTIVYNPNWNKGIIGIVASRLIESYYKPTVVFTDGSNGEMVASARSVADFDLHEALDSCSDLFMKFGGHKAAAGLSIEKKNFEQFKLRFEKIVEDSIEKHQKIPSVEIDSEVSIADLDKDFFKFHKWLEPFGPNNMKPYFTIKNVKILDKIRIMGKDDLHLKFNILDANSKKTIECLAFNMGKSINDFRSKNFDLVFSIEENYWQGNINHFLNIKDVYFH